MRFTARLLLTAAPKPDMDAVVLKYMRDLDPEGEYNPPSIKVVNRAGVGWLGLCKPKYSYHPNRTVRADADIFIQAGCLKSDFLRESVTAHEVAHHVVHCRLADGKDVDTANKALRAEGDHGKLFHAVAAELNAKYGEGFVTQYSDVDKHQFEAKEVFVVLVKQEGKRFFSWSPTVTAKWLERIKSIDAEQIKMVKSSDYHVQQAAGKAPNFATGLSEERTNTLWTLPDILGEYTSGEKQVRDTRKPGRWLIMCQTRRGQINAAVTKTGTLSAKEKNRFLEMKIYGIEVRAVKLNEEWLDALPSSTSAANSWQTNSSLLEQNVMEMQKILEFMWNNSKPLE